MDSKTASLARMPLFKGITDEHMAQLAEVFEKRELPAHTTLFTARSKPEHLYILVSGEVALEDAEGRRYRIRPPAPLGELGTLTGLPRSTTAVTAAPSEVWRVGRDALMDFFERHGDIAFPVYHNLLGLVADKIRRDDRRIREMRDNIVRTQKAMKRLRELVLAAPESEVSQEIHDTLDGLIDRNRRANYVVEPPAALPAVVRSEEVGEVPVREICRSWIELPRRRGLSPGEHWSGVLVLPEAEIPVSGKVREAGPDRVRVELDLMLDEYAAALEDYLTRAQMLSLVV